VATKNAHNGTLDRNLALELVRVTESAALMAGRWMGRGQKESADQAAVDAMRTLLGTLEMEGIVVIGEGSKDEAPMLYIGEKVGRATQPKVDIAVDPIDGTRLLSNGMPNSIAVLAVAERGTMYAWQDVAYMDKLAVGADAAGMIDINASVKTNLTRIAKAKGKQIGDLTVVILDRPRHEKLIADVRAAGARIKMISDGDVGGAVMAALPGTGLDVLMGIGGAPEAVIAACALKCLGGDMQCKLWPRNDEERTLIAERGIDAGKVFGLDDLVSSDNVFFAATGITDGELLHGVNYTGANATTDSLVMRSRTGTVRRVTATHSLAKLRGFSAFPYD
jgi:fructose-1,6-bisphosphatase II